MVDANPTPLLVRPSRGKWIPLPCGQCGEKSPFLFSVKDAVWLSVAEKKEFLCITCFEGRLGRPLRLSDLKPCGITSQMLFAVEMYRRETNIQ